MFQIPGRYTPSAANEIIIKNIKVIKGKVGITQSTSACLESMAV